MVCIYRKTKREADRAAAELQKTYRHVSIASIRNEWEICYCCSTNPNLYALLKKLGERCQESYPETQSESEIERARRLR